MLRIEYNTSNKGINNYNLTATVLLNQFMTGDVLISSTDGTALTINNIITLVNFRVNNPALSSNPDCFNFTKELMIESSKEQVVCVWDLSSCEEKNNKLS